MMGIGWRSRDTMVVLWVVLFGWDDTSLCVRIGFLV